MAGFRGIVVAVFSFHVGFVFVLYTGCPVLSSMSCRHKKLFHSSGEEKEEGEEGVVSYPELARAIDSSLVMES